MEMTQTKILLSDVPLLGDLTVPLGTTSAEAEP
jgi:hypothetical protein